MILSYVNLFVIYMKKAIIWARVSSQEQAQESYSVNGQMRELKKLFISFFILAVLSSMLYSVKFESKLFAQ